MKNISVIFSAIFTFFLIGIVSITAFSQIQDKSGFSYWQNKMEDPDQNYFELVEEFENYCTNKNDEELKTMGYKHFKRWQHTREGTAGPDGKLLPASYFLNEIENFKQLYGSESILGDWEFIGPDVVPISPSSSDKKGIGRLTCVTFHPTDPNTIFVGAHTAGIWKTTTGGDNWTNLNTDQIPNLGVSAICVHPSNPNIILIGTGDRDANHVPGYGIWKSIDGGNSWTQITSAMKDTLVSEILVRPDNEDILLAAAEDGVYLSTDFGDNWVKTTGIDRNVKDMVFKPGDPSVVYATGHGEFYKTTTFGLSWNRVTSGLFTTSRMTIGVTPDAPNKVFIFATRASNFEGFYVSANSGHDFTKIPTTAFAGQGFGSFCIALGVDPTNEDIIYAGMQAAFRSLDGGNNWTEMTGDDSVYPDQHAIEFSPYTNDVYFGNDGGLYHSSDGGVIFENISDGLEVTQVCRLAVSETNPDIFLAGLQDNGTIVPANGIYHRVDGNDGMNCAIDYTDDQYMYASSQKSHILRSTTGNTWSEDWENISGDITELAGWFRPYILDKDDPNTIFAGFQNVWRSNNVKTTNAADVSWVNISDGQITFDDKRISLMEQSNADGNVIYVTLSNGVRMYRTDNAYAADPDWVEITRPESSEVKCIETHGTNPGIVYMAIGWEIYKSIDRGETWSPITGDLPDIPMRSITFHKGSDGGLYAGTRAGVYYKDNTMTDWVLFKSGLPLVEVFDMKIIYSTEPDRLVVGTWGRGVWKTDVMPVMTPDLNPINANVIVTGTEIDLDVVVMNDSQMADAGPYFIGYYVSDNDIISPDDYLLGDDSIHLHNPGIIVGEDISVDIAYFEPELPTGTYYIGSYVDYKSEVEETHEWNNNITCTQQITLSNAPAPTNVQASDGTFGDKIVISWDPPPGPTVYHYKIYRNTVDDPNTAIPITSNPWNSTTAFWDTTATRGIDNFYWVQASDTYLGFRAGLLSSSDAGWRLLNPPTNVEATYGQYDDRIALTWDAAEGATHYMVWRHTTTDFNTASPLLPSWTPTTTYTDWTAAPLTTYFYWVKSAMSSSGNRESPNPCPYVTGLVALTGAPTANASDGLYHDRIEVTWNTIPGATHYRLYHNTVDDPETATPFGAWQAETFKTITTTTWGIVYYYWVKAAVDQYGGMPSGLGDGDSGWRNFTAIQDVQASDGTSTDHIEISWDNNPYADYCRVYRCMNPTTGCAVPITDWITKTPGLTTSIIDETPNPPWDYYYWVKCANDPAGLYSSDFSSYDVGWKKLSTTVVEATKGAYADKIRITWDPVPGAYSYRIIRFTPSLGTYDTLSDWSSTLNFQYNDYDVEYGASWVFLYYYIDAAFNNFGYKPGDQEFDYGYPGECGNLSDDPNYRNINFHGSTLEITQRIFNNGFFPLTNPSEVAYLLQETPPVMSWNHFLGTIDIPALAVGDYYDISFIVDLDTISDGPVQQGTWSVASYLPWDNNNCQSNQNDDYMDWGVSFEYTDALHGVYTIGGTNPDFPTFANALVNLMDKGISDHVIFNIRPGTYYEQISIPAITGSGPDKTITFQTEPNKADNAELNFTSNEGNYTIQFDGCSYITIQNLDLTAPGYSNNVSSYGIVLEFINNANHISILNNTITGSEDDTYISTDNAVIYSENSECNDITIQDNEILNGSWGVHFVGVGSGSNLSSGLEITGNTIQNFMHTGIKLQYQENPQVIGNTIQFFTSNVTQSYGMDLENLEGAFKINKNHVIMEPCGLNNLGISMMFCEGNYSNRALVSNNFVAHISAGNTIYGIYSYHSDNVNYYHNSVNITGINTQNNYCMYIDCSDVPKDYDNDLLNNVFANQAGGYSIAVSDHAITHDYISSMDYNDLYSTGSYIGLYGIANQVADLTAWKTASGFDQNSISYDPEFFSDTDLHSLSYNIDNMGYGYNSPVLDDIDDENRVGSTPDMGADEYTPPTPQYDAAITELTEPFSSKALTDQETITIVIENWGTETISNFPVSYSVDAEPPVTETVFDAILSSESYSFSFATTVDLSIESAYSITAEVSLSSDVRPTNDTYTAIVEHLPLTHCAPIYINTCNTIFSVIDNFYLNTIEHEWTACSENSYGNYTGISTDLTQGQSYNMEVSVGYNNMYVSLWIDLDNDTDFEPSEQFVSDLYCGSGGYNFASVYIPVSAMPGPHRLRVRAVYNETGFNACDEYLNGEAHDYMVNIVSGGNLSVDIGSDMNSCYGTATSIIADVTGGTTPYNFLWSTGETTPSISTTPLYDSLYSVIVTDAVGYAAYEEIELYLKPNPVANASSNSPVCDGSDISLFGTGNYFGMVENRCQSNCDTPMYCESKPTSTYGPTVEEVVFGDINNNTMSVCSDYSDYTAMKTIVSIDDTLDLFVTLSDCDNYGKPWLRGGKAYIDWNRDGDFKQGNELVGIFNVTEFGDSYDTTVIVPSNAVLGKTILRVVTRETMEIDSVQDCGTHYWMGETEDYTIEIIERVDNYIDTYSWTGPDSYSSVEQNPIISSSTSANAGTYSLTVADGNGCTASDNTIVEVKVDPSADAGPNDIICENETYLLYGQASNYSTVLWSTSGNGSFDNTGILDPVYTPSLDDINSGEVALSMLVYASAPCTNTALSSMTLTIINQPVVFAGNDATINEGETYAMNEATALHYTNLEWSTNGTGSFDDAFTLNPEYTPGTGETGIVYLILTGYVNSPCTEQKDTLELEIIAYAGFDLDIKVLLHGPFNGTDMNTSLNSVLPLSQPYSNSPWYYPGAETTALIPNPDIVDWILIELRDAPDASSATPGTTIDQQAAFLLKDGSVVGLDGSSILSFDYSIIQSLFVVVWHRNHIGVISANPLVRTGDIYSYDFTTDDLQVLGGSLGYKELIPGTWGMVGGDGDANGNIETTDKSTIWAPNVGSGGYKVSDFNMDTQTDNKDKNDIWLDNSGKESQIPD